MAAVSVARRMCSTWLSKQRILRNFCATPIPTPSCSRSVTEEGIIIHQESPYRDSMHLVWGNILWDAGLALSKFFAWQEQEKAGRFASKRILELGAGTGVVGLTLGKLGACVTMTDCEPEVMSLLRKNAAANGISSSSSFAEVDWSDTRTFMKPSLPFEFVVAADVLYAKKDRWFMRTLKAHMQD
eukprot:TRINITY_DN31594_c0_g1_i2.p1 TRINITY_DN31594_c0_g1~~TRINITY_DN31594_c0_g1_i2.p1  ORF type:complete len:197 (-),score=32.98 TRINITY_DN31594_c0_g1_i2:514-1068(-)